MIHAWYNKRNRQAAAFEGKPAATSSHLGGFMTSSSTHNGQTLEQLMRDVRDELTQLNTRLDRLEAIIQQTSDVGGTALNIFDSYAAKWRAQGIDVEERAAVLQDIVENLTRPSVLRNVHKLSKQTHQVNDLLQVLNELPGIIATGIDIFDSMMDEANKRGLDMDARIRSLGVAGEYLSSPAAIATLEALFGDGDALDDAPVDNPILQLLIDATGAVRETIQHPRERTGMFGLLRAGRDKDVQTFTAFSIRLVRSLGQRLRATENAPQLDASSPQITE